MERRRGDVIRQSTYMTWRFTSEPIDDGMGPVTWLLSRNLKTVIVVVEDNPPNIVNNRSADDVW